MALHPLSRELQTRAAKRIMRSSSYPLLTPEPVPFVLEPRRAAGGFVWVERGQRRGSELKLIGGFCLALGALNLFGAIAFGATGPVWFLAIAVLAMGAAFLAVGLRTSGKVRTLTLVDGVIRLQTRQQRGEWAAEAAVSRCVVAVHQATHRPWRGPGWRGHVAALKIPGVDGPFVLAASRTREIAAGFAAEVAALGVPTGEGEDLLGGVSVWVGRRSGHIEQRQCPGCGAPLAMGWLRGCGVCSWGRR